MIVPTQLCFKVIVFEHLVLVFNFSDHFLNFSVSCAIEENFHRSSLDTVLSLAEYLSDNGNEIIVRVRIQYYK